MTPAISPDLRARSPASYDESDDTHDQIACRFRVSLKLVNVLRQQSRRLADIRRYHHRRGRKHGSFAFHRKAPAPLTRPTAALWTWLAIRGIAF